jgi:hypothetical protein
MRFSFVVSVAVLVALGAELPASASVALPKNTTGVPLYPKISSATVIRPLAKDRTNFNDACDSYQAYTKDSEADVVSWYRAHLVGPTVSQIQKNPDGDQVGATDFALKGGGHATVMVWSSADSNTRIDLWKDRPGAGCRLPGL